jgi:hypothetical protein
MAALAVISARDVAKAAKVRGLTLSAAAVKPIVRAAASETNGHEALTFILDSVKAHLDSHPQAKGSRIVGEDTVLLVVADLSRVDVDFDLVKCSP